MKKYDELWHEINTLLTYLRGPTGNHVVELVNQYYSKFDNDAPGLLLKRQIEKVQKRLNDAEMEKR